MIPPTSIDGTDITGATIDGTDVTEITVDGDTVFTAGPAPGNFQFDAQDLSLANGDPVTSWPDTLGRDTLTGGQNLVYDTTTMNDAAVASTNESGEINTTNSTLLNIADDQNISLTFTFELIGLPLSNNNRYFGFSSNNFFRVLNMNKNQPDGAFRYDLRDDNGNDVRLLTNAQFNDGNPHICVITHSGGGVGGVDIFVDDMASPVSTTIRKSGGDRTNLSASKLTLFGDPDSSGAGN